MDDQLRKFRVLIESGSFTKAALKLHISQPALSISVQKLEREMGAQLIHRDGKRLRLTEAGRAVYSATEQYQLVSQQLNEKLRRISRTRPHVSLGMIDSVADILCTSASLSELEESADITLNINNSRYLRNLVTDGKLDGAIVVGGHDDNAALKETPIFNEQLVLVSHTSDSDYFNQQLGTGRLPNFISYDRQSNTYKHIQGSLLQHDITIEPKLFSTSPGVMLHMVLARKGCAVLPLQLCQAHINSGKLVTLSKPLQRPITFIASSRSFLTPHINSFIESIRRELNQH